MSQRDDQLDSGGGISALFFDPEHQERWFWRFCNSRLPQSEVVYFTQIFIIIFLITVSLIKLVFFKLDCEESTFWFSLLSCTVGYALPKQVVHGCLRAIVLRKNWSNFQNVTTWHFLPRVSKNLLFLSAWSAKLSAIKEETEHRIQTVFWFWTLFRVRKLSAGFWRFMWRNF